MIGWNWAVRDYLHLLRPDGRLALLTALMLHADDRMRCFPSIGKLTKETGWQRAAINNAKKWLIERGAIVQVPYDKRKGAKEEKLPSRNSVYKLTGFIRVEKEGSKEKAIVPYLLLSLDDVVGIRKFLSECENAQITADDLESYEEKLRATGEAVILLNTSSEISLGESSVSEPKGLYSKQGLSTNQEKDNAREDDTQVPAPAPEPDSVSFEEEETKVPEKQPRPLKHYYPWVNFKESKYADGSAIEKLAGGKFHNECSALFDAWAEALRKRSKLPITDIDTQYRENFVFVKAVALHKYTPDQVKAFVEDRLKLEFYADKVVTWKNIAGNLPSFAASKNTKLTSAPTFYRYMEPKPAQVIPPEELAKGDEIFKTIKADILGFDDDNDWPNTQTGDMSNGKQQFEQHENDDEWGEAEYDAQSAAIPT